MSLINDALQKADRDRTEAAAVARLDPLTRARQRREQRKRQSLGPILAKAAGLGLAFAVLILVLFKPWGDSPARSAAPVVDLVPERPAPAELAAPELPAASPFTPPEPDAPPPAAPSADYALAGMTAMGDEVLLSIVRQSDQRSVWVPVGKSVGEITAVRYDPEHDLAVIRVGGRHLTLRMGSGAAAAE